MLEILNKIKNNFLKDIDSIKKFDLSVSGLEALKNKYLGRKSELVEIFDSLKKMIGDERKKLGQEANILRQEIENILKEKEGEIKNSEIETEDKIDFSMPGRKFATGHLHPISIVQKELEDLFSSMGFMVLDGPELESEYYNFEALNIPASHPARDMQDTFYIEESSDEKDKSDLVMRTHTSPVQIRAMRKYGAPFRGIAPGRVFRSEATDIRHEHTFYQLEGLMVDKDISLSNMKSILEITAKHLYGHKTELRLRPKLYPFVEPGCNCEVSCFLCKGNGCRLCKQSGWLEIAGAGLVHPSVLKAGRIDEEKYSGFAFGFGLTRMAMLKYGVDDVRLFNSGDIRFLEQF